MNERIKQLAEQAKRLVDDKWNKEGPHIYPEAHYRYMQELDEKFAELIVKECADLFDPDLTVEHEEWIVRKSILQHFGVEE